MVPRKLAPEIFRQRMLIEGFFSREIDEAVIGEYLLGIAAHLGLRTYGAPVVFAPASEAGQDLAYRLATVPGVRAPGCPLLMPRRVL